MRRKLAAFLLLTTLVTASSFVLADPPARVGRISSAEGQVTVRSGGEEASGGLLNWPLTSDSMIDTAPGARMEFRIGSAAVRLDGDSSLAVEELDDDTLRLRLNYGSASVRIVQPDALAGFELSTPQTRLTMTEPGFVRIDAERAPDTSVVSVLTGTAQVDGAGTLLTLRAGRQAQIRGEDVSTGQARRDAFDAWAEARDQRDANSVALRYVTPDVTGYEELDRHGSWTENDEYGALWAPRSVAADWAPYRDGRWTWLDPWGWTWVDNAPWGYAPSHYGRWVMLRQRWYWAPGRIVGRPAWSPALVGWMGGSGWNVTFANRRQAPGMGWFPLSPRDRYQPPYRVSPDHERRLGWQGGGKWKDRDGDGRPDANPGRPRDGLTVLPRDHFDHRRTVQVRNVPRGVVAPRDVRDVPLSTAPVPPGRVIDTRRPDRFNADRDRDGRADWRERRQPGQQIQPGQPGQQIQPGLPRGERPGVIGTGTRPPAVPGAPPVLSTQQPLQPVQPVQPVPAVPAVPAVQTPDDRRPGRFQNGDDDRRGRRTDFEDNQPRWQRQANPVPQQRPPQIQPQPQQQAQPQQQQQPPPQRFQPQPQPQPQPQQPPQQVERRPPPQQFQAPPPAQPQPQREQREQREQQPQQGRNREPDAPGRNSRAQQQER